MPIATATATVRTHAKTAVAPAAPEPPGTTFTTAATTASVAMEASRCGCARVIPEVQRAHASVTAIAMTRALFVQAASGAMSVNRNEASTSASTRP